MVEMANDSQRRSSEPDRDQDHEDDSHDQQALLHKSSDDSSRAKQPSMTLDMLVTVTYCLVYLLVGPALILVNKKIMKDVGFSYPMMVSGFGQLSSAICSALAINVFRVQSLTCVAQVTWPFYLRNMMVVGGATAASLCFGNAGYLFLTVSFVQILKAFTPVFVVAMLYVTRVDVPSRRVTFSVVALCLGTSIASVGELKFNLTGLVVMFVAETCEATRLVLTQKLLTNLKFPALEGLYYMAPICSFWMFGLATFIEMPGAFREGKFALVSEHPQLFALSFALGFLVNVASFLVIKRTSSIMLKLMGTARNAGLVLFSALFLGDEITATQAVGYAIGLFFFGLYNYYKMNKM